MDKNTEHFLSALDMLDEKFIESALEVATVRNRTEDISADDLIVCEEQSHKASRLSIFALSAASVAVAIAVVSLVAAITLNKIPVIDSYSSFVSELFSSSEDDSFSDESTSDSVAVPDIEVKEKIKFMSYYEPDKNHPAFEVFRELYGTPDIIPDGYKAEEDDIFAVNLTNYYDQYEKLSIAINSGNSPDITPFTSYGLYSGEYCARYGYNDSGNPLFEPINDIVDISGTLWDNVRWMNEKLIIKGQHYAAITSAAELYDTAEFLWYKKSQIEKYGLSDPYELYIKGEWTWDTFTDFAQLHSQKGDDSAFLSTYSYLMAEAFALASGETFVDTEDGRFVSRLSDEKLLSCMDYLEELVSSYKINVNEYAKVSEFADDEALFLQAGALIYEDISKYIGRGDIPESDIGIVPVPKKDKQSEHYYPLYPDGYYLCKGGNAEYFKAFINALLIAESNGSTKEYNLELRRQIGYSDEISERLTYISQQAEKNPVIDLYFGMSAFNHTSDSQSVFEHESYRIVISPVLKEMSYKEAVELYGGVLEEELDKINS